MYKIISDIYYLKDAWERIENNNSEISYYNSYKYCEKLWNATKDSNKKLMIICLYKDNYDYKNITAIAPFVIYKEKLICSYVRTLKFLSDQDSLNIIIDSSYLNPYKAIKEIFKCIEEISDEWDRLNLSSIDIKSPLAKYLLKSHKYNNYFNFKTECPTIDLTQFLDFNDYKKRIIPPSIKSYKNKLQKDLGYTFHIVNGKDNAYIFDQISSMHSHTQDSLKDLGKLERISIFDNNKDYEFLKSMYFDNENIITFIIKSASNEILAFASCYLFNNKLEGSYTSYNFKYSNYNLGKILYFEIVQYLLDNKISDSYSLGNGKLPWKFEWTEYIVHLYTLDIWNKNKFSNKLNHFLFNTISTLRSNLKQNNLIRKIYYKYKHKK